MTRTFRRNTVAALVAGLAVAGGGAAVAATKEASPQAESSAVIADAASQLGISSEKLSSALKASLEKRVDAAVAAGELTQAEGTALKQRIEAGEIPLIAGPRGGPGAHRGGPGLDAAASYLGLTTAELRTQLESGKTLAQVASAEGKSAAGLIAAMVADAKQHLAAAVAAGRLTEAQAQAMLADLEARITDLVDNGRPSGPPPAMAPPSSSSSSSSSSLPTG
jgi:hypothetical protein